MRQHFDIRNFLLCMGMGENVGHELVQPYVIGAVLDQEKKCCFL